MYANSRRAVVVGSGFGGLSAAALLAAAGWDVTVVEKNSGPGGRAMVFSTDGFTFDMGPSWYLMPDVFEAFFARFGKRPSDYYKLHRLNPSYRIFFGKNHYVDVSSDFEENVRLFESIEPGAGDSLRKYVAVAKYQYEAAMSEFLYRDYKSPFDFLNKRTLTEGRKLHVCENLDRYSQRYFSSDRLRKILEYSMVFLGGSPANTPAMYSLLSHVDFNLGVWYPIGGMGKVVEGIKSLAESLGARFVFDQPVTRLVTQNGRAVEVETSGGSLPADVVVVNADYAHAELELLDSRARTYPERYWRKRTLAPSAFMIYLGLRSKLPGLMHHTLSFEYDWMRHFDAIFESPEWPERPSYYIACPTKTDDSVAPPGNEAVVVLVPVAPGLDDNDEVRERFAQRTIQYVEDLLDTRFDLQIVTKTVFSQRDFRGMFNAYKGTALGLSHTLLQTAFFRPRHRSKRVSNLYYTGQYTHPGIGMPMALISSTIVAQMIDQDLR